MTPQNKRPHRTAPTRRTATLPTCATAIAMTAAITAAMTTAMPAAHAAPVAWTQWTSGSAGAEGSADGHLSLADGSQVQVRHEGELRYAYTAGGGYFWNAPACTYTSPAVDNAPNDTFLQFNRASAKTVSFSQALGGVFMAVFSLNDNYYEFDQDFRIESQGCGSLGCGTLSRQVVDGRYRLVGQQEGHGVIRFLGDVSSVTWTTHHAEDWQGVTFGAYGVAPVPEPSSVALSLAGLALIGWRLRRSAA